MKLRLVLTIACVFVVGYAFSSGHINSYKVATATATGSAASSSSSSGTKVKGSELNKTGEGDGPVDWIYDFFKNDPDSSAVKSDTLKMKTTKRSYPSLDRVVY